MSLQKFDSGDSQMDSSELLKFIQQNESVAELQSYADQESNKLLRWVRRFAQDILLILSMLNTELSLCLKMILIERKT